MMRLKKEQYRALPLSGKIRYFWGTQIWDLGLGAMLLLSLGTLVHRELTGDADLLHVEMINGKAPAAMASEPAACARSMPVWEPENVAVSTQLQLADKRCDVGPMLFCKIHEERTDVYFWDSRGPEYALKRDALTDLRNILPAQVLEEYEDRLIYNGLRLNGGYPCGIRIQDNSWLQGNLYYGEGAAVGVARSTDHPEQAAEFLMGLLAQDS